MKLVEIDKRTHAGCERWDAANPASKWVRGDKWMIDIDTEKKCPMEIAQEDDYEVPFPKPERA